MLASAVRRLTRPVVARAFGSLDWATTDPKTLSADLPCKLYNLVGGEWMESKEYIDIPDPMNAGEPFIQMPNTKVDELGPYFESAKLCTKSGLHNPYKNPERYVQMGEICYKAASMLQDPEILDFFTRAVMRVMPKSYAQAQGEVSVTRQFLKNFGGDQCRFAAQGMNVSGDHDGQISNGFRWPFGPVAIVAPFNFPLEIPVLQLMGALMMGNKVVIKGASTTSMVLEQWIRLLHECGLPMEDVDLIHCGGRVMGELLVKGPYRITQFTGSSGVSEDLCHQTNGKVRVEDAGFDWKIVGPDVVDADYVAWQCDQDAYAATGQKCSAESMLFMHKNWVDAGLEGKLKTLAERRSLDDLTIGAVLSETTKGMLDHCANLLAIPGARLCWGGKELESHTIPEVYGAIEPTAVFVPITEMVKDEYFNDCVTEIFGPFQVLTEYTDEQLPLVLEMCERMSHHLTAAVVSNDVRFTNHVLGNTVNGTTYAGIRARTTGAPQNHWFGPAGDPRGAGIGTPGAIRLVWSCHREIINDNGNIPAGWTTPPPS